MQERITIRENVFCSNEMEKTNDNINSSQLPIINNLNNDKRIYIHKPSDFLKNKYTFFGNFTNNRDILDKNSKKALHSPKFDLNDIKKQIQKGNEIIGSIIKEENSILPNLLKNYIINYSDKNPSLNLKTGENYNTTSNNQLTKNNISISENRNITNKNKYKNDLRTFTHTNRKEIYSYKNNINNIMNQKHDRLINLNFLVSSPKKIRSNYNHNKNNYYQFLGSHSPNKDMLISDMNMNNNMGNVGNKFNNNKINNHFQQRNIMNRGNFHSMDASNRMSNMNMYRYQQ